MQMKNWLICGWCAADEAPGSSSFSSPATPVTLHDYFLSSYGSQKSLDVRLKSRSFLSSRFDKKCAAGGTKCSHWSLVAEEPAVKRTAELFERTRSSVESKCILTRLSCLWQLGIVSRGEANKNKICMNSCQNSLIQVGFFSAIDVSRSTTQSCVSLSQGQSRKCHLRNQFIFVLCQKKLWAKKHDAYTSFEVNKD